MFAIIGDKGEPYKRITKLVRQPYTKFINVSTTHENPVPLLYVSCYEARMRHVMMHVLNIDLQIGFKLNKYNGYEEIAYSAFEHKIYVIIGTKYTLKLAVSNFYVDKLSMGLQFGADVKLTTTGKLNAPENVTVQVLTPTLAIVHWMPPKKLNCVEVNYEVYQGTVKNLEGSDTTPIAIKMLRENASSREKKEFLQEAKLMSHFRHKNVLRLLGICLDADSPLLIL
ncbi:proto-oncogene tyrosine-protein kinase ros [Lasius niger]|uniref:receptor protein-tyrosine kinase n=1 Tax=Lasius niger TaxID=67767 RepID=A0A0J7KLU0_LASNI|nr:proto-oncogene tyrosine-protein kinase ros [Lasius niger]